ncbi:MAG: Chemotaxis protein methyltransferase CheR [Labilithrix sp.]|nr:Chemotaxis protein methyltransferase CheR [Labilithrix sp.]
MPGREFIPTQGEVAGFMRQRDWASTALGDPSTWPGSLRTVLRLMLGSRYAMWMGWGKDLSFFYNDEYAAQTLGPKHPWALGCPAADVWSEIWDQIGPRIAHVLATGEASYETGLLLFLERNGYPEETYHSFSYSAVPGDAPGEIAGLFCVVVEETDRVVTDRRMTLLRELSTALAPIKTPEDIFVAALRSLRDGQKDMPFAAIYTIDDEGHPRAVGDVGFGEGEAPDVAVWPIAEVLASRLPETVALPRDRAWPKGAWQRPPTDAFVVPILHQGREGVAAVLVLGVNPHRPLDDAMRGFVELLAGQLAASFGNARAYREQEERARALAEVDRAKTAFFSNVSHEFRTPLTLMLGPTQDALASPERALKGPELETVHRNELRLLKLVNGLLDFARIEAGRTSASFQPTDLAALTADLASSFRSAIERAGLDFDLSLEPMPEPIYVDQDMWEKIVLNLLSNALKFTFKGAVKVRLRWRDDHAEVVIADTGVGVAAHELPRMFERFHRIEGSRARTHEGSGIGLALVHDLVTLHGGSITVASELDKGTEFTITLPRGSAHLPPQQLTTVTAVRTPIAPAAAAFVQEALRWSPDSEAPTSASTAPAEGAARVLVADDNADMRDYIARILGQHFQVHTVPDGAAALRAVKENPPDLVLSDVMMPEIDGFELVRQLRSDPEVAAIPVILLSARAGEEATAEGLRTGADDYLVKPFSAGSLLVRIEAQLSAARLRRTLVETAEAERRRLLSMFEDSPAAIAMLRGPQLTVELANPRMMSMWGNIVLGRPLLEAVPALRGQGFDELLLEVLRSGIPHHGREVRALLEPERPGVTVELFFDFVYAPVRDERGDAVIVHAFDVTDKVRARQNVEQLREVAEAANRVKDEFLATMSHELRTPLNAMLGWSTLLRGDSGADWSRIERGLSVIERNARAQSRLIDDVLDVSRIISGKLRLEMAATDLVAVARAAVEVVRPAADAKEVTLLLDLPHGGGIEVMGDADRLQQVAWNLLSNAVKFTPAGGTVTLRIVRDGNGAELSVQDTGIGIQPAYLMQIFERFRQVDSSSTRKYGGLGLGLAIVRHLVELHGGSVRAESDGEGRGTTFRVTLPTRVVRSAATSAPAGTAGRTPAPRRVGAPSLRGTRVLVVDDDDDSRSLLESVLVMAGAEVRGADSARAAFELLRAGTYDVLVSDIGMPEEDGYALLARVRQLPDGDNGKIPAIALTAYASAADVERAERAGFQRHLAKPADLDSIVSAVAAIAPTREG